MNLEPLCVRGCIPHEYEYEPAKNEAGWRCYCGDRPGEPPGFSPHLDSAKTTVKVDALMAHLHDGGFAHISSNSECEEIVDLVVLKCHEKGVYDQYSILAWIMATMAKSHRKYWKKIARGVLDGRDPRDRCPCGELSTSYSYDAGVGQHRCKEHYNTGVVSWDEVPKC